MTLLARLEGAGEGSRELDALVAEARGWQRVEYQRCAGWQTPGADWIRMHAADLPRWTTSVDAALTLVPEGWTGMLDLRGEASIWMRERADLITANAHTLPLAICIAALRAAP